MTDEASAAAVAMATVAGGVIGPLLRAAVVRYAVPPGEPWRHGCPSCGLALRRRPWLPAAVSATARCRGCRSRLGPPPFVVEPVTIALFVVLALRVDGLLPLAAVGWVAGTGVVLWYVDLAVQRLPDRLTIPAFTAAVTLLVAAAVAAGEPAAGGRAALAGLGLAAAYLTLFLTYPDGIGLGDAKLALSLGAVLGWYGWTATVLGALAAFTLGGLVAAGALLASRVGRHDPLPHGPFMLLGALAAVLVVR